MDENRKRGKLDPEFELMDTGYLMKKYFDVFIEYAKADTDDLLIKITVHNRGPEGLRYMSSACMVSQYLVMGI